MSTAIGNTYSVPSEILALKPTTIPCCVKKLTTTSKIGVKVHHYYVYERIMVEDKKRPGRKKGTSGLCIGKIEGGVFTPNQAGRKKLKPPAPAKEKEEAGTDTQPAAMSKAESDTVRRIAQNMNLSMKDIDLQLKNYGEYAVVLACTGSVLEQLNKVFSSSDAAMIYVLSVIYFVCEYTPASYLKNIYDQSILSNRWPSLAISENNVGEFLEQLGLHPGLCDQYSDHLIQDSSGLTAIDGHVILTCSTQNDLADYGNKYQKLGNRQMNVLQAYDAERKMPLTSKVYDGGLLDKVSVKDLLTVHTFPERTIFLIDMGFYSEDDLGLYREGGKHFVIPLPENTEISKAMRAAVSFSDTFVYERNEDGKKIPDTILYKEQTVEEMEIMAYEMRKDEAKRKNDAAFANTANGQKPRKHYARKTVASTYSNDRLIMYRDKLMHDALVHDYREQIGRDEKHTEERLAELEPFFGLIILRTNLPGKTYTPEMVYCNYKKRWTIETHYNFVENAIDFSGLQTENYAVMQGLAFLMISVGQIKASFVEKMKGSSSSYVSNMSIKEAITKAGYFKFSQRMDMTWHTTVATRKQMELLESMGVSISEDLRKLNSGSF